MGLDHVDLIYAIVPPPTLPVAAVVEQVAGLIASGRARAWGTGMWSGEALAVALDVCDDMGAPRPVAAQMGCSLAEGRSAGDPTIRAVLDRGPIGLVAAHVLAGGTLTGKYLDRRDQPGRAGMDDSPVARRGREIAPRLAELGTAWGVAAVHLPSRTPSAIPTWRASCSAHPPDQVRANVGAVEVFESLNRTNAGTIDSLA